MSHAPQGECGLKLLGRDAGNDEFPSLPARGVWIEISTNGTPTTRTTVTPRKGSVD